MKVGIGISWQIVVDGKIDSLDIDTSTEDISSDTDSFVELLEFLVSFDSNTTLVLVTVIGLASHTFLLGRRLSEQRWMGNCTLGGACQAPWHEGYS